MTADDPHRAPAPGDVSRVTSDVLDDAVVRSVEGAVSSRECGAVVTFRGVVRDVDGGRDVTGLDYEAHPDATEVLRRCCATVSAETGLRVAAVHRYGVLTIGDVALVGIGFGLLKDNPRD